MSVHLSMHPGAIVGGVLELGDFAKGVLRLARDRRRRVRVLPDFLEKIIRNAYNRLQWIERDYVCTFCPDDDT